MAIANLAGRRAAIYVRISSDPGGDELGIKRQERECRELCKRLGLSVAAIFPDDDRSAFSGKPRPAYLRMLDRLEQGDFQVVVAWHPDRLHRSPRELEGFIDLIERTGTAVVTVQTGEYDLSTPSGRMTARVVGAVARHESEHKSERIRSKMNQLREEGRMTGGGRRPFGFNRYVKGSHELTINPEEAAIARELAERYLAGESLVGLMRNLNRRGVQTVTGRGPWTMEAVRGMLMRPSLAGLREHNGQLVKAPWPAIIDPDMHHRIRARVAANVNAGRRAARRYLLTGIAYCGRCGAKMVGRTSKVRGGMNYLCLKLYGGCNGLSCTAPPLEALVTNTIFDVVESPDFRKRLGQANGRDADLDAQRESLNARAAELARMWADGELTRQEWSEARARLKEHLDCLGELEAETARDSPLDRWVDSSLRDAWPSLTLDQRRAIAAGVIAKVVIGPHPAGARPRFDSRRVTIERRF